eukprot:TRINITY_DN13933_c0_g1_i6.p2 TRINITY_DN13933_c0_g1~~TRINITY_DN13933_c0_g1_i6.p2  ORF type:complete len:128 (-),score=3.08 TRINITY_DN13933_c0_g1_i6:82-465(-)
MPKTYNLGTQMKQPIFKKIFLGFLSTLEIKSQMKIKIAQSIKRIFLYKVEKKRVVFLVPCSSGDKSIFQKTYHYLWGNLSPLRTLQRGRGNQTGKYYNYQSKKITQILTKIKEHSNSRTTKSQKMYF